MMGEHLRNHGLVIVVALAVLLATAVYTLYAHNREDFRQSQLLQARALAISCGGSADWIKLADKTRNVAPGTIAINRLVGCNEEERKITGCIEKRLRTQGMPYIDETHRSLCSIAVPLY